MISDEALRSIEKLHEMRKGGIISEEEFELAKKGLLGGSQRSTTVKATPSAPIERPAKEDYLRWALLPLRRPTQFEGRSERKEFWFFYLAVTILGGALFAVAIADTNMFGDIGVLGGFAYLLLVLGLLVVLIPFIAVQVRRLHDQDRSGWFALLNLVPYIGAIIVLVLMALPGTEGDNRYGPDPRQ